MEGSDPAALDSYPRPRDPPSRPVLPDGCVLGVPIVRGVELPSNPYMTFTAEGGDKGAHNILQSALAGVAIEGEARDLRDVLYGQNGRVDVEILNATPLMLAIQQGDIEVVAALIVVEPKLFFKTAIITLNQSRRENNRHKKTMRITPLELAEIYVGAKKGEWISVYILATRLFAHVRLGSLFGEGSITNSVTLRERIKTLGLEVSKVVDCMLAFGQHNMQNTIGALVTENAYTLILGVSRMPDISLDLEKWVSTIEVDMPSSMRSVFTDGGEGDSIYLCETTFLAHAIIMGNYEAACALLLICPALASLKVKIRRSLEDTVYYPTTLSMLVKFFDTNGRGEAERLMCFRIISVLETNVGGIEPLGLETKEARIEAAGLDPKSLIAKWTDAVEQLKVPDLWHSELVGKRKRE